MASAPSTPSNTSFQIPTAILDDLCSRFIINIPEEERQDLIRVFFQIELAHWFYLDFYCHENTELKARGIKDFSTQIFKHCPTLTQYADSVEKIHGSWREYKMAVPTYGAILLDPTLQYCILVQGFWSKASWGFPKGKVNEDEKPEACAVREVLEETGFDCGSLIDAEEYIEYKMHEQLSRLYLIPGVSKDTLFAPRTRKEIKNVEWFKIEHLPSHKKDLNCKSQFGLQPNSFFMVIPFVKPLRKWINKRLGRKNSETPRTRETSNTPKNKSSAEPAPKAVSEKQRAKQQQQFAQQNQSIYNDFMKYKEMNQRGKGVGSSPVLQKHNKSSKQTLPSISPRQKNKPQNVQILKREGNAASGSSKKSLTSCFNEMSQKGKRDQLNEPFMPEAWKNFKLDINSIMMCYNGTNMCNKNSIIN